MVKRVAVLIVVFLATAALAADDLGGFAFKPSGQPNGSRPIPTPSSASCADPSIHVLGADTGFAINATTIRVCIAGSTVWTFGATSVTLASATDVISADDVTAFVGSNGSGTDARITTASAAIAGGMSFANGVNTIQASGNGTMLVGATSDQGATTPIFTVADNLPAVTSSGVDAFAVYGENTIRYAPGDALATATPTDTTSTPLGSGTTGAGSACFVSSTGASAWTPSETGAVSGMHWCCHNTGTNAVTMTNSAGVYQGTCAMGQYDMACFWYRGDRFVQQSCMDNP